jgi:hypothetical protein
MSIIMMMMMITLNASTEIPERQQIQVWTVCEISGSHGGENEDDCLLGCCAV